MTDMSNEILLEESCLNYYKQFLQLGTEQKLVRFIKIDITLFSRGSVIRKDMAFHQRFLSI